LQNAVRDASGERSFCDSPEFEGGIEILRQALVAWSFDRSEAWRLIKALRAESYGTTTSAVQ
jgi:hypothetical protein